jgi:hypothetical protein
VADHFGTALQFVGLPAAAKNEDVLRGALTRFGNICYLVVSTANDGLGSAAECWLSHPQLEQPSLFPKRFSPVQCVDA